MPQIWLLSDGTTITLGGDVSGNGEAASLLRRGVAGVRAGRPLTVSLYPMPGGDVELELDDPATMDAFVRDCARCRGVQVVETPEVGIPPDPRGELPEPEADEVN